MEKEREEKKRRHTKKRRKIKMILKTTKQQTKSPQTTSARPTQPYKRNSFEVPPSSHTHVHALHSRAVLLRPLKASLEGQPDSHNFHGTRDKHSFSDLKLGGKD